MVVILGGIEQGQGASSESDSWNSLMLIQICPLLEMGVAVIKPCLNHMNYIIILLRKGITYLKKGTLIKLLSKQEQTCVQYLVTKLPLKSVNYSSKRVMDTDLGAESNCCAKQKGMGWQPL